MGRDEIEQKVAETIAYHLGVDADQVRPDARLAEDLDADNLDLVQLAMTFEELFGIEVGDDEAEDVITVADLNDLIVGKLA